MIENEKDHFFLYNHLMPYVVQVLKDDGYQVEETKFMVIKCRAIGY